MRECSDPAPAHGGEDCDGENTEAEECGEDDCPREVEIPAECGMTRAGSNRIVNGRPAKRNAWPWLAALGYTDPSTGEVLYLCGATLITNKHVVTAAHCIRDDMVTVLLGVSRDSHAYSNDSHTHSSNSTDGHTHSRDSHTNNSSSDSHINSNDSHTIINSDCFIHSNDSHAHSCIVSITNSSSNSHTNSNERYAYSRDSHTNGSNDSHSNSSTVVIVMLTVAAVIGIFNIVIVNLTVMVRKNENCLET